MMFIQQTSVSLLDGNIALKRSLYPCVPISITPTRSLEWICPLFLLINRFLSDSFLLALFVQMLTYARLVFPRSMHDSCYFNAFILSPKSPRALQRACFKVRPPSFYAPHRNEVLLPNKRPFFFLRELPQSLRKSGLRSIYSEFSVREVLLPSSLQII